MIDWRLYLESNPAVLYGKPTIKNTRIPVDLILEKLAMGDSVDGITDAYPNIDKDAIRACLFFAAHSVKNEIVFPIAS